MNEAVKSILGDIIRKDYPSVPDYAFTAQDYINELKKTGLPLVTMTTAHRRLVKRVESGELIRKKQSDGSVYYIPSKLKKNIELDEEAIKSA